MKPARSREAAEQVHFKPLVEEGKQEQPHISPITTKSFNTEASSCAYDFAVHLGIVW